MIAKKGLAEPKNGDPPSADDEHPRSAELQLRAIIEQLADGIVIVDSDGIIRFANPAAEQLFSRSSANLVGTPFGFPITSTAPAEIDLIRPRAEPITVELRVVHVRWQNQHARLVSLRDVTDRKRSEERARLVERERLARIEAEVANRAKSEFLATMSHELRTPLNAVIGYAQLLDLGIGGMLSREHRQHVTRILATSRHLLGLVSEVLDLSKVDVGQLGVHIASTPAIAVLDAAAALVEPLAEERGVTFEVRANDSPDACFAGDEERVRQILVNLLTNAVKFTDAGGRITLEAIQTDKADPRAKLEASRSWTAFHVTDTGIGIPEDQCSRIFEPFVQVKSLRARANDGSGLGLAISHRLAQLMGGDITVRSKPGEGSTFTLWLPAAGEEQRGTVPSDPSGDALTASAHGLSRAGDILLHELASVLSAFANRLRAECRQPGAETLKYSQLADHVGAYVADLALVLTALEESDGAPSSVLLDALELHRVVAIRHGAQRARLGWTSDGLTCEYQLLRDEIERVLRQDSDLPGPVLERARAVLGRLLEESEEAGRRSLVRSTGRR
jgi:PAS domain S-box-containing protein